MQIDENFKIKKKSIINIPTKIKEKIAFIQYNEILCKKHSENKNVLMGITNYRNLKT